MPRIVKSADKAARRKVLEGGLATGMSLQDMGAKLGVTRERVRQLLRETGLRQSSPLYPTLLSKINEDEFRRQSATMTQMEMAKRYSCSVPTIRASVAKLGAPKRKQVWQVRLEKLKADGQLWCTKCKAWKPVGHFYRMAKSKTGFMALCTACIRGQYAAGVKRSDLHVERLEKALTRALCGCTALNCRVHGGYVQAEAEFALSYVK